MISVDHQPLVSIFSDHALEKISNPWLFNFKEQSLMYRFNIKHAPGKHHVGLDATSRYPSASHFCALLLPDQPHHTPNHATDIEQCVTSSLAKSYSADRHLQAITWEWIHATASQDKECQELLKAISNGFLNTKETLPEVIHCFWPMRDELYSIDGVILKGEKILIPFH